MKRAISIALAILVLSGAALGRPDDLIRSVRLSTAGPVYFGQTVDIIMRAAPGGQASWFVGPRYGPMRERAPGVYVGRYRVREADWGPARIRVTLFMPDGRTAVRDLGSVALDGSTRAVVRSRSAAFVSQDMPPFPEQVMAQISPPPGQSAALPYGYVSRSPLAAVSSYSLDPAFFHNDDYAAYQPPYYGLGVPYSVPTYAVASYASPYPYAYPPYAEAAYPYAYAPYAVTSSYPYGHNPYGVTSSYLYAYNPFGVTSGYPYVYDPYGVTSSYLYAYSPSGVTSAYYSYAYNPFGVTSSYNPYANAPYGTPLSSPGYGYSGGLSVRLDNQGIYAYAPRAVFLAPAQPLPVLAAYPDGWRDTFMTSAPSLVTYAPKTVYRTGTPPYGKAWGYWARRAPYAAVAGAYSGVPRVEIDNRHASKPPRSAATWANIQAPRYASTSVPPHGHAAAPRYANAPRSAYTRPAPRRVSPPAPTLRYSPPAHVHSAAPRYTAPPPQVQGAAPRYTAQPAQVHSAPPRYTAPPAQVHSAALRYTTPPAQVHSAAPRYTAPPPQAHNAAPRYTPPTTQGGGASRPSGGSGGGPPEGGGSHSRRH